MSVKITPGIAILITVLFFSCKKDKQEEPVSFTQDLYYTKMTTTRALRVFTNKTEITDEEVKARFIKGNTVFNLPVREGFEMKMTFQSKDLMNIGELKYTVKKNNDLFLFYSGNQLPEKNSDPVYDLLKYADTKVPVINVQGVDFLAREVVVGHGDYKELNLALFKYRLKRADASNTLLSINEGGVFNEFNDQFITKLGINDTLAVQEYVYNMKAK